MYTVYNKDSLDMILM